MRYDRAIWVLGSVSVVWGASYLITGWGLRDLDVVTYNAIRFATAAPLLLALTALTERGLRIDRFWWPRLAASAAVGIVAYQLTFSLAVANTTVTESAILIALSPFFTAFFALMSSEPVRRTIWIGGGIALLGVILVVVGRPDGGDAPNRVLGDLAALSAAILWGAYPVVTRPLLLRHSPVRVTPWAATLGALVLTPAAVIIGVSHASRIGGLSAPITWFSLAFSVAMVTVYGLIAWYWGVRRVGSARTMVFMFAVPVIAAGFAVVTGAESVSPVQIGGAALVLAALAYTQIERHPGRDATPAAAAGSGVQ